MVGFDVVVDFCYCVLVGCWAGVEVRGVKKESCFHVSGVSWCYEVVVWMIRVVCLLSKVGCVEFEVVGNG